MPEDEHSAASTPAHQPPDTAAPTGARGLYQHLHTPAPPLEQCLDTFWESAVPLDDLPPIPAPPDEPYEILKRLGPSPFEGSSFPLVGFFASAYERVRRFASERAKP